MQHEIDDLAARLRSTVEAIEFQRAQPPLAPPPQWHTHNPWAPIFPGQVATHTPSSIGFAQPSHNNFYAGLQEFLIAQMQQVQQRLQAMEEELKQADRPQLVQPCLLQQNGFPTPPRRELPQRQESPWLPEQPGDQVHMVQGKGRWGSLLRSPNPTEPGRNHDQSGTPSRQMTTGKPTVRLCRFGVKCKYQHLHCPFKHPGPTEAGASTERHEKVRKSNLHGAKRRSVMQCGLL